MKNKNDIVLPIILIGLLLGVLINIDKITDFTARLINPNPVVTVSPANEYAKNIDYMYVQKSTTYIPYSKQDIMNIFYSILDQGYETFTFYCPSEYSECIDDIEEITEDQTMITDIGNFVHPYNNFTNIKVVTDSLGEVDVIIYKMYDETKIQDINKKVDDIFKTVLTDEMDIYDKILALHDYVIDNTYYDMEDSENSGNAYGIFYDGKSKCAGYADAMAIMLSKLGIKNYKVASEQHVWNALYIDGSWYQIDLTWDDPVADPGSLNDNIRHKFYMIDTPTLYSYDTTEHTFDETVYRELKTT